MNLKICAAGILLKDSSILLGKRQVNRDFYPDTWDIIGGQCENGETLDQTLSRELEEEIGVTPTRYTLIAVFHEPRRDMLGDYEYHIYLVPDWIGNPRNLQLNEHSEIAWFHIEEALQLELAHPKYPDLFSNIEKIAKENR